MPDIICLHWLQHGHLPCLDCGSRGKPVYLPVELCHVASGQRQLKLTERQTAEMIKVAAQRPADRFKASSDYVSKTSGLLRDSTLKSFQLALNMTMMKVSLNLRLFSVALTILSLPNRLSAALNASMC